jgi:hypothetical protein
MSRPVSIGDLAAMLADRVEVLCAELLPLGRREGHEYVEATRAQGGLGDSLRVHLRPPRRGVWAHFAAGPDKSGDALDLVAYLKTGGDKAKAAAWARAWLGLDARDPRELEAHRDRLERARKLQLEASEKAIQKSRDSAFALWLNSMPLLKGTLADRYLEGRGISLARLGRQPRVLRFHPAAWNAERQAKMPAMIAKIDGVNGKCVGVHRTYLALQPDGSVTKAPLKDPKKTWGLYRGGCIRLWRGASGKALGDAPEGESVIVCEGIEDGLTLACAYPDRRILVAVSLSNMGSLELPPQIAEVVLCADNDENQAARDGLSRAIDHFLKTGKRVRLAMPPAGAKDVNALLQQATQKEGAA